MRIETIRLKENDEAVTLTAYLVDDSPEMLAGKKRPAVLIAPGGGYLMCSDREAEPVALAFASMGYHAFVLRYSVYFKPGEDIDYSRQLARRERSEYPTPVRDYALAMRCIYEHAEEWLVDQNRIAICGFSAGAHNTAMYAALWNQPIILNYLGTEQGYRPAAVILGYGVYDNYTYKDKAPVIQYPELLNAFNLALMGDENPDDDLCKANSPALFVTADFPPAFLWSTFNDDTVPVLQTAKMASRLIEL